MVVGMFTLAVPGSANFAGEFAILAGVFTQGWGYAAVGAAAIVLAALYTLRLISAVLHRARGAAVSEESLDLGVGELALVVPLVAILLALSVWPAAISERSFPRRHAEIALAGDPVIASSTIATPKVDWLGALTRARAARRRDDLPARRRARAGRREARRSRRWSPVPASSRRAFSPAVVFDRSPVQQLLISESMTRDRLAALAQILVAGFGLAAVLVSWGDRRRDHVGEYYALLAAAGGGMVFFVSAGNLMTLFLGLEWFSIALYILVALDTHRKKSLEAGLKYLIVGSFGSAILLFGSALTYGATGELGLQRDSRGDRRRRLAVRRGDGDDHRRARVQGLGRAVPHVDAGRLRGRADAGDGVHVGRDEGRCARRDVAGARDRVPRAGRARGRSRSPCLRSPRS